MITINDKVKCTGCASCFNICPVDAITMEEDFEGFLYPHVDQEKCIGCNRCEKVCPYLNSIEKETDLRKCFAAYNLNTEDRSISSSGGVFVALAKRILSNGGIIFGAAFDENYMVYHKSAKNDVELRDLIGSKYMQSRINLVYRAVKTTLKENKLVLFVGSGCQIGGLLNFLSREYDNLVTVDFICLGVPSPKVWADYLSTFFDRNSVSFINFKDKSLGWHEFSLKIDGREHFVKSGRSTYFFSGYFKQLYSRPSCSDCLFKKGNRLSDLTISDCWGYNAIAPEMDDNKGLSSIVCHSEKGLQLFEQIQSDIRWKETDITDIYKYNKNYCISAPMGKMREKFWNDYNKISKEKLFFKYCKPEKEKSIRRIYKRIRSIFFLKGE